MKNKEKLKTFSVKKLLITILCTVIVSTFIGSTILFLTSIPTWMYSELVSALEKDSKTIITLGKSYENTVKQIHEQFSEDKAQYGDDYPAEGIFLFKLVNIFSTNRIVGVYAMSFTIGVVLGTIIYIVAVQKTTEKKMVVQLLLAFIILVILMILFNWGYEAIINKAINDIEPTKVQYSTYIYDIESNNYILIQYIVVAAVIYIINIFRQKIIANKLNKELNNM